MEVNWLPFVYLILNILNRGLEAEREGDGNDGEAMRVQRLKEELREAKRHEMLLDAHTTSLQESLRRMADDETMKQLAYLTHVDIRNIPCFTEDTLLAVKAPYGSTLEVPDPDEGMPSGQRRYEVQLCSRQGPIDVFLIQDTADHPSSDSMNSFDVGGGGDEDRTFDDGLLKHFQFPTDGGYNFEMKEDEGVADLYGGFNDNDVFRNIF